VTELERALVDLGRQLEVPPSPDLVSDLRAQLVSGRQHAPRRRLALAVAFVVLAGLAATLAVPAARSALFRVLHIGGEEIQLVDQLPEVEAQPDLGYVLGQRVSIARARHEAGFDLRELAETPDRVYLGEHGTVWFLYGSPERVHLLVAQTELESLDRAFILKKLVPSSTEVRSVSVEGARGYFLSGGDHIVLYVDEHGREIAESARLARNVLVWSRGGLSYRLEGDFTQDRALEIARSLR
jgi:hypothetical protein